MSYATLLDVEIKWRTLDSATDQARANALLAEAEALLDQAVPTLAANVSSGAVPVVLARKVVTDAVIRVLANPAGVTAQTVGPETVQWAGVRTLGTIAFTKDELSILHPADSAPMVAGMAIGSAQLGLPRGLERELHPRRWAYEHAGRGENFRHHQDD